MVDLLFLVSGLLLIGAAAFDATWTTLSLKNAGPITGRVASAIWLFLRGLHRRRPSHTMMSFSGTIIVVATLLTWVAMMWLGWTLVFASSEGSIVDLQTREPVDFVGKLYFAGFSITTLGTGDVVPVEGWRVVTILASASGLVIITLAITYFGPVIQAVMAGRRLATYIASMGESPERLVCNAWADEDLRGIDSYLATLADMLNSHIHRHHGYPVIHFFHTGNPVAAVPLRLAVLDEALTLMEHVVAPHARPHPMSMRALRTATSGYLDVLTDVHVIPAETAPPVPDLGMLRDHGIPIVGEDAIERAYVELEVRRRLLRGLVEHDGWSWKEVPIDGKREPWRSISASQYG